MSRDSNVILFLRQPDAIDDLVTKAAREGERRMLAQVLIAEVTPSARPGGRVVLHRLCRARVREPINAMIEGELHGASTAALRSRSRAPASIGSNQLSKGATAAAGTGCAGSSFVLTSVMTRSPLRRFQRLMIRG